MTRAELERVAGAFAAEQGRGWLRANCPLCLDVTGKEDSKQSMGLNTGTAGFICHKCGSTGRLPPDLMEAAPPLSSTGESERKAEIEPARGFLPLFEEPGLGAWALDPYRAYVRGRGIADQAAREAGVGAIATGYLRGRVVIPHFDLAGDWAGWIGRAIYPKVEPVYRYSKGMTRNLLWNQRALEQGHPFVLLVEGAFDALPYWPWSAAFLGKPTRAHIECLRQVRYPVVVALDGDSWEEGWVLAQQLKLLGVRASSVRLPPGEDPGSVDPGGLLEEASKTV